MGSTQHLAEQTVRAFVARVKPEAPELTLDTSLFAEEVGLDSMDAAELSATLEDALGADPFAGEVMPQTMRDIIGYFDDAATVDA